LVTLQAQVEVHLTSSAPTANYYEIVSQLAPATNITSHDANWEDYEDLLDLLGEANGPLISNNEVKLRVLTQISTGENQLIFEGFYLDGRVPLGGGFDCELSASRLDFYHKQVKTTRRKLTNGGRLRTPSPTIAKMFFSEKRPTRCA
jgi:hypothetical protein